VERWETAPSEKWQVCEKGWKVLWGRGVTQSSRSVWLERKSDSEAGSPHPEE
jgi:hypothetical protein